MVTTITESYFNEHFAHLQRKECNWLGLKAANGLDIPYSGYVEMEIVVLGQCISGRGVLIVKDPEDAVSICRKTAIPGILGMNVLGECYQSLFEQLGPQLFHSPLIESAGPAARQALKQCERIKAVVNASRPFRVRIQGKAPICLKADALTMVPVSCPHPETVDFLLEPPTFEEEQLPEGLLMSPTLVCARKGLLYAPVVNFNTADVWLPPRRVIGTVQAVTAVPVRSTPITVDPSWEECCAFVSLQEVSSPAATSAPVQDFVGLTQQQAIQAQSLFDKYSAIFSQSEVDLGCTPLITHEIPLLDDAPVRQPY